ncbi:glycosyltransferase family 9 protein [candidate division KSB1 bacterium]|nr:glycosyltransferase family 9 protein [candidate division KSB1 bacterium]
MRHIDKILIIKLRAIGDVVLSTIVLDNIRAAYPEARIDFLTDDICKEVVLGNPILNNVLSYERKTISRMTILGKLIKDIKFLSLIRNQNYDLVIDYFGNPRSAIMTWLSNAWKRVGYDFRIRRWAYNVVINSRANELHEADWHLDALKSIGIPVLSNKLNFHVGEGSKNFAENFWQQTELYDQRVIALNFSGGWPSKRWPLDRFAHLADTLVAAYRAQILIVWGPGDKEKAQKIQHLATCPVLLLPDTNLKQLAAILQKVDLLVTTDSGPMHIAAAMGTPCVALFGPTNPKLQGPYGQGHQIVSDNTLTCLGCNRLDCENIACMDTITVGDIMTAVQKCITANQLYESLT